MSIALFAVPGVLTPLQGLWRWFMPVKAPGVALRSTSNDPHACDIAMQSIAKNIHCPRVEFQSMSKTSLRRPLRIVRVLEAGQAPSNVGRMVISGRMADVCAELDRLAAHEATLP